MEKLDDIDNVLKSDDILDSVIADALSQLTVQDREQVYHEIHGINDDTPEHPEFVAEKLEEMQRCVDKILESPRQPTAAYELALSLSQEYVTDPEFRLGFLRVEKFDADLAAIRMIKHFDFKFGMYGGEKLCKDITYDDLDQDDKDWYSKGYFQWLPERDRTGRPVVVYFPSQQVFRKGSDIARIFGRVLIYHMTILEKDENVRKKGVVMMVYNVGKLNAKNLYREIPPIFRRAKAGAHRKIVSNHVCFSKSSKLFRLVFQHLLKFLDSEFSATSKLHYGTQQEVKYQLMTYGIPANSLPVDADNKIKTKNHLELLDIVRKREEYLKTNIDSEGNSTVIPNVKDVLFGKGETVQNKPGNIRLKNMVDELLPLYETVEREAKTELHKQIVKAVNESGGRFLSKDAGFWMAVTDDQAKAKVGTLFRNRRKAAQKAIKKATAAKTARPDTNVTVFPLPTDEGGHCVDGGGKRLRV